MKTPLDCQLLSLGLQFVQAMKAKDLSSIPCENCHENFKILMENEVYNSLLDNFCTIHAIVTDENQPKVLLQFSKNENDKISQTLICSKDAETLSIQVTRGSVINNVDKNNNLIMPKRVIMT